MLFETPFNSVLVILRGIPGSGKSYYAESLASETTKVVSADDYFLTETGEYVFDPSKLGEAHASCFKNAMTLLRDGYDVVVDNTNTQVWEMAPYILLGAAEKAKTVIIRIDCDPEKAAARNSHGVPKSAVLRMAKRMEKPLPFWPKEGLVQH